MAVTLTPQEYERYRKLVGMLGSAHEGERNNALSFLTKMAEAKGVPVHELLLSQQTVQQEQPQPQRNYSTNDFYDTPRYRQQTAREQYERERREQQRRAEEELHRAFREARARAEAEQRAKRDRAWKESTAQYKPYAEDSWAMEDWRRRAHTIASDKESWDKLNDWEQEFIQSIIASHQSRLTQKQLNKLEQIEDKVAGREPKNFDMGWWPGADDTPPWED